MPTSKQNSLSKYWFCRQRKSRTSRHNAKVDYTKLESRELLATFDAGRGGLVVVNFEDGRPATAIINGEEFVNPDPTLHIDVEAEGPFDTLFLELRGDSFNVDLGRDAEDRRMGTVNDSFTFLIPSFLNLTTGGGDDVITEDGRYFVQASSGSVDLNEISTGAGDDVFVSNGGFFDIELGAGDDRFVFNGLNETSITNGNRGFSSLIKGGEGHDVFESRTADFRIGLSRSNGNPRTLLSHSDGGSFQNFAGNTAGSSFIEEFERIVGADPLDNPEQINSLFTRGYQNVIEGNLATVQSEFWETDLIFENFNYFNGLLNRFHNNPPIPLPPLPTHVLETSYPLNLDYLNRVVIGGGFLDGDTSQINHVIDVIRSKTLVVTDSGDVNGHDVFVAHSDRETDNESVDRILGLTGSPIYVDDVTNVVLSGSDAADDRFFVTRLDAYLVLYGHGGNDRFILGHNERGGGQNLSLAGRGVTVVGGEGFDVIRGNDRASVSSQQFRVRSNWLHLSGNSVDQTFRGIRHFETERFDINFNSLTEKVLMSPSKQTRYFLDGGLPDVPLSQVYQLVNPFPEFRIFAEYSSFSEWFFGRQSDSFKLIRILR